MELEVMAESSPNPPEVRTATMKTTLVMRDQQMVIAAGQGSEGKSLVAFVMPYIVRGKSDLARIYQCKTRPRGIPASVKTLRGPRAKTMFREAQRPNANAQTAMTAAKLHGDEPQSDGDSQYRLATTMAPCDLRV